MKGKSYILRNLAQPLAHYPHMRLANGFLYISGVSARQPDGTVEGKNNIEVQTEAVIENLRAILQAASADLSHVVDITAFLLDMRHYAGYNTVYNRYFTAENGPTRTTVGVKELPGPDLLIEMKAVAVVPVRI